MVYGTVLYTYLYLLNDCPTRAPWLKEDTLRFVAGYRKRRLNQTLVYLSLSTVISVLFIGATFVYR